MNKKNTLQTNIDKLTKINVALLSASVFCMFSYVILLGLTSAHVVSLRSTSKIAEDIKTELSTVELGYMSSENVIALEDGSTLDFSEAVNIAYVNAYDTTEKAIAIAD